MLKKRLTDRFKVVYWNDDALHVFSDSELSNYLIKGRDISMIDLKRCTEPVTIFTCDPLRPKYQYLLDAMVGGKINSMAAWQVFKSHVRAAENFNDDHGKPLLEWTDDPESMIKDDCMGSVDTDVLIDIASVIVKKAGDVTINFTLPDTYWVARARSLARHANDANTKTVSETNSP